MRLMIESFACKETLGIWEGRASRKLPQQIQQVARRKLRMLNRSKDINDLRVPPANRLEALKGNLQGFYSIRINQQWRIIFRFDNGHANQVQIIDYH